MHYQLTMAVALATLVSAAAPVAITGDVPVQETQAVPAVRELSQMAARFVPTAIAADIRALPASERQALAKLVDAARLMDSLFLRQVWAGNDALLQQLARDTVRQAGTGAAGANMEQLALPATQLHYFLINKGPWSRLDHNRVFIAGVPAKPEGASFYPAGASKEEIQKWIDSLSGDSKGQATGFFTVIRRTPDGRFTAVPYSVEYQGELARAASLLREAASLTNQPTLKKYLSGRADAFITNDYYASDVAWMELDASIEPTIGPYEVYEDEWFNYKAAFEAFITVRDDEETKKLQTFSAELQGLENALPVEPRHRNPKLGALAPIRVVNVVFTAGDANSGVQTAAFNLPNDERVVKEKGTKRVMLKNVQEAKFRMVLQPIAQVALPAAARTDVSFDAFFTHILMHELMHGLGPHNITVDGRATTVRQQLKETYSVIEEAKADVSGLWALKQLGDRGRIDRDVVRTMYTTFLASAFRSIRFGINEAHGRGIAIQLNYLLDAGAVRTLGDGTFAVDDGKIAEAVTSLTREILTLQAEGSYEKAKGLIDRLGVVRPAVKAVLDRLSGVPVDIEPKFVTAQSLSGERPASRD
jgi:hypothetical protein